MSDSDEFCLTPEESKYLQGVQLPLGQTLPGHSAGQIKQKMSYEHMVYLASFSVCPSVKILYIISYNLKTSGSIHFKIGL